MKKTLMILGIALFAIPSYPADLLTAYKRGEIKLDKYGLTQSVGIFPEKIFLSQEKEYIGFPTDFSVLDDESILIIDAKDRKILFFNKDGIFIKQWRSLGQGPGEYQGLIWGDYSKPYYGIFDARAQKLILYRREGFDEFKWIKDVNKNGGNINQFRIEDDIAYYDSLLVRNNEFYCIQAVDLIKKTEEYFLPASVRYGRKSEDSVEKYLGDFSAVYGLPQGFIDVCDGYIYSAWKGTSDIIKIEAKTKEYSRFSIDTKNYREPKTLNIGHENTRNPQWKKENILKYSWTVGVFADKDIVGIIYSNYDTATSAWKPILRLFDSRGAYLRETELFESISTDRMILNCYSRYSGYLYILNTEINSAGDVDYRVNKHKIRK